MTDPHAEMLARFQAMTRDFATPILPGITVPGKIADRIVAMATMPENDEAIATLCDALGIDRWNLVRRIAVEPGDFAEELSTATRTAGRDAIQGGIRRLLAGGDILVSDRARRMIGRIGIDIDPLMLLSLAIRDAIVIERDGIRVTAVTRTTSEGRPVLRFNIVIVEGVTWMTGRTESVMLTRDIPETAMSALAGRPLRDLVSHPLLDETDAVIAHIQRIQEAWCIVDLKNEEDHT